MPIPSTNFQRDTNLNKTGLAVFGDKLPNKMEDSPLYQTSPYKGDVTYHSGNKDYSKSMKENKGEHGSLTTLAPFT